MAETPDPTSLELERLVRRYEHAVRRVAGVYDVRDSDLDELFQDVRIRLWKSLESAERLRSVKGAYVVRAARSALIDGFRRRRARGAEVDLAEADRVSARDDVEARLDQTRLESLLDSALDELMDSRRPVVRMHLSGYSREEIADLLGWTEAKTRNLLYRGLADLRTALAHRGVHAVAKDDSAPTPPSSETRR